DSVYSKKDVKEKFENYVKEKSPSLSDDERQKALQRLRDELPDAERAKERTEENRKNSPSGRDEGDKVSPVIVPAAMPVGRMHLATFTLLPHLKFTLPILILAAAMWFAWRVVNQPVFADFLIATEAELNKVSWTTR